MPAVIFSYANITSLSVLLCAGALVGCSDSTDSRDAEATTEMMTSVSAASMLADNVTSNVSQIRIIASDEAGEPISTDTLSREAADNFLVPADAHKVELGLLTGSGNQVGVIIFQPATSWYLQTLTK